MYQKLFCSLSAVYLKVAPCGKGKNIPFWGICHVPQGFRNVGIFVFFLNDTITKNNKFSLFNNIYEISYFFTEVLINKMTDSYNKHNIFIVLYIFLYERCMDITNFGNNYVK
jgi:hypothetical protein